MKTNSVKLLLVALLSTFILHPSSLLGQGVLTPPGAPAPTMKTLDQIEPRTIVNAANTPGNSSSSFIISQPGSYYLTTNLTGVSGKTGIEILTNNITLDLNGFALQGVSGSVYGIDIPFTLTNITVRNGMVSGWGNIGVYSESTLSLNLVFERLNVSGNGGYGFFVAGSGTVRDCNCEKNSVDGIYCASGIVSGCTANTNLATGIEIDGGIVSGCSAQNNIGHGIYCNGGAVSGCSAQNNGNCGIVAVDSMMSECSAQYNGTHGIYVMGGKVSGCFAFCNKFSGINVNAPGSEVIGNTCNGNNTTTNSSAAGIYINDKNNRVEDNHVAASGYAGIQVYNYSGYTNNIIIKNSVIGNGANNYIVPNSQIVGPLITNTVSGIITNSNPWANFSF